MMNNGFRKTKCKLLLLLLLPICVLERTAICYINIVDISTYFILIRLLFVQLVRLEDGELVVSYVTVIHRLVTQCLAASHACLLVSEVLTVEIMLTFASRVIVQISVQRTQTALICQTLTNVNVDDGLLVFWITVNVSN